MITKKQLEIFKENPVIASVRSIEGCEEALAGNIKIFFMVGGNYFALARYIGQIKKKGGLVFVYIDLINGIGKDTEGIEYLVDRDHIDGILSTKAHMIKLANRTNLISISRLSITDKLALKNGLRLAKDMNPDILELTPGLMPRIVKCVSEKVTIPIITSGLISRPSDVRTMLAAGAMNIATSEQELWNL